MSFKDQIQKHQTQQHELAELRNKIIALEHEKEGLVRLHAKQMQEVEDQYTLRLAHIKRALEAANSALRQAIDWTTPRK